MPTEPDQAEKGADEFGLDDRLLEELKEKVVAAKERAYCRFLGGGFFLFICLSGLAGLSTWSTFVLRLFCIWSCIAFVLGLKIWFFFGIKRVEMLVLEACDQTLFIELFY